MEEMIKDGRQVMILLDATIDDVDVPGGLKLPQLILKVGSPASTFLSIDDDRIQTCLQFGGTPYICVIPWKAVIAIALAEEAGGGGGGPKTQKDPPKVRSSSSRFL